MILQPALFQETPQAMVRFRKLTALAILSLTAGLATPALASDEPSTRLVSCGSDSCLLVSGHRESADAEVRINGHRVDVEGERNWRTRLPVGTVREWSVPFARKIEVSSRSVNQQNDTIQNARLPIGLLGHVPDLAELVITLN
jgi:hypothetical protein